MYNVERMDEPSQQQRLKSEKRLSGFRLKKDPNTS